MAGCYERGRCEKGTKGREGLFQFFGEINRIISTLSWFVSCLMIRYLFKVGKDTSVVFYTSCTKFCDIVHLLCPYICIRPVSVCSSEMRARGTGKCLDRQQPLLSRATCFLYQPPPHQYMHNCLSLHFSKTSSFLNIIPRSLQLIIYLK